MQARKARLKEQRPIKLCKQCGKPVPEGRSVYCSKACMDYSHGRTGQLTPEPRKCIICGKVFTPPNRLRRYTCSPECSYQNTLQIAQRNREKRKAEAAAKIEEPVKMQPKPQALPAPHMETPTRSTYLQPGGWTGEITREPDRPVRARLRIPVSRLPYRGEPTKDRSHEPPTKKEIKERIAAAAFSQNISW